MPRRARLVASMASMLLAIAASAKTASAHQVGLSRGDYVLHGDRVDIELRFSQHELALSVGALDADHDAQLSAGELDRGREVIERAVFDHLSVTSGGARCSVAGASVGVEAEDAVLTGFATCPAGGRDLSLSFGFLVPFAAGHRHLAHVRAGLTDREVIAVPSAPSLQVDTGQPIVSAPGEHVRTNRRTTSVATAAFAAFAAVTAAVLRLRSRKNHRLESVKPTLADRVGEPLPSATAPGTRKEKP